MLLGSSCLEFTGRGGVPPAVRTHEGMSPMNHPQRAEEDLEKDRNLLRTLIDHLPDCIYIKDLQHRFVAANAAVARAMGTVPEDLAGEDG